MAIIKIPELGLTNGVNKPSFLVTYSGNQTIATATDTKMLFDTTIVDTNSAFDFSNNRFVIPTGKAGLYVFYMSLQYNQSMVTTHLTIRRKDSSDNLYSHVGGGNTDGQINTALGIQSLAITNYYNCLEGDRIECSTRHDRGSNGTLYNNRTFFGGFKLIGV